MEICKSFSLKSCKICADKIETWSVRHLTKLFPLTVSNDNAVMSDIVINSYFSAGYFLVSQQLSRVSRGW